MTALPSIGPYELFQRLARFEHSDLWLARSLHAPSRVLTIELSSTAEPLCSMAKTEAQIEHASVAAVLDLGLSGLEPELEGPGQYYLVRDLFRGPNLVTLQTSLLAAKALMPASAVLEVGSQLASCLDHVHTQCRATLGGLEPGRILVDPDGRMKISGFVGDPRRHSFSLNQMAYWAPEHLRGEDLDARSDVFSLGVLLFELATGRRLFKRSSIAGVTRAILEETRPEPSALRSELSWGFDRVLARALAINPGERQASAEVLRQELEVLRSEVAEEMREESLAETVRTHGARALAEQEDLLARFARVPPGRLASRPRIAGEQGEN